MSWLYERNRRGMQGAVNSNFKRHCFRVVDRTIVRQITFEGFSGFFFVSRATEYMFHIRRL